MSDSSLDHLRATLNRGEHVTLDRAADLLGVSRRQVRRLIGRLDEEGLTIHERYEDGVKQFWLDPADRQVDTTVTLSERQFEALTVAALAAQSVLGPTPFDDALREAVDELLGRAGMMYSFEPEWQQRVWHFDEGEISQFDPALFTMVVRAAHARETLRVTYYSASSRRTTTGRKIDPLQIARQGETWLVAAYDHSTQEVRDFSMAGLREAEPTGSHFTPPSDFDAETHFEGRFHALAGSERRRVVVQVEASKAPYFDRKQYHPSQEVVERHDDGSIRVAFEASSLDDVAAFIRSWGPGVKVLAPEALAHRLAREAREVAAAYDA